MARLEFLIEGEKVLSRNLRVLADGIKDMKDDFQKIGDLIEATAKENFENQGSETGSSWKKLAPSTIESRTKRR